MLRHIFFVWKRGEAERPTERGRRRKSAEGGRGFKRWRGTFRALPSEGRRPFKPQTVLLRRRPTVGVEPWIPFEREKWSYTPRDLISSNRKARGCTRKRSSENGPFASSSEELGYNSQRSGLRRTLVRPRRMRKERPLWGSTGRKSFLPNITALLTRKHRQAVQGERQPRPGV